MIGRRAILTAAMAAAAGPVLGQMRPKPRGVRADAASGAGALAGEIHAMVDAARLGGKVGLVVASRATGRVLVDIGGDEAMPPASVTKAVTALFVQDRLGAGHRFSTRILATGPMQGGVLQGDLILAGGGDASLDTDRLGDMAAGLAAAGLRRITGQFLVWSGALPQIDRIAPDQPDYVGYNPCISGAMLNYNRAQFVWSAQSGGAVLGVNAEGARFNPPVRVIEVVASDRAAPLYLYEGQAPRERWSVARPALQKSGSRWLPVRRPAAYIGDVFASLCASHGIDLPMGAQVAQLPAGTRLMVQDQSATLGEMLRDMLRYSTNLTAEATGLAASQAGDLRASAGVMGAWAAVQFGTAARFVDHSGLGAASLCTPRDMLQIFLRAKGLQPLLRLRQIDMAGREVKGETLKNGPLNVWAKSGTLNFTSHLAGYVQGVGGQDLAFAIFIADGPRRAALPLDQREDPPGGAAWARRARALQRQIIAHCAASGV